MQATRATSNQAKLLQRPWFISSPCPNKDFLQRPHYLGYKINLKYPQTQFEKLVKKNNCLKKKYHELAYEVHTPTASWNQHSSPRQRGTSSIHGHA